MRFNNKLLFFLHCLIIFLFVTEFLYAWYQVFFVFGFGDYGILFSQAVDMSNDLFIKRRLYAIEGWIAFSGFALYLSITELFPRIRKKDIK